MSQTWRDRQYLNLRRRVYRWARFKAAHLENVRLWNETQRAIGQRRYAKAQSVMSLVERLWRGF